MKCTDYYFTHNHARMSFFQCQYFYDLYWKKGPIAYRLSNSIWLEGPACI